MAPTARSILLALTLIGLVLLEGAQLGVPGLTPQDSLFSDSILDNIENDIEEHLGDDPSDEDEDPDPMPAWAYAARSSELRCALPRAGSGAEYVDEKDPTVRGCRGPPATLS